MPLPTPGVDARVNVVDASGGIIGGGGGGVVGATATQCIAKQYTGAANDDPIVSVSAGSRIVVTGFVVVCSALNSVNVAFRLGFGLAVVPAYNTAGLLATHPNCPASSGIGRGGGSGVLGAGADGEDVRFTCTVPTGGAVDVMLTWSVVAT